MLRDKHVPSLLNNRPRYGIVAGQCFIPSLQEILAARRAADLVSSHQHVNIVGLPTIVGTNRPDNILPRRVTRAACRDPFFEYWSAAVNQ